MARPGSQKNKGNGFERELAATLSTWMYGDKYVLGRDPTSGARGTVVGGDKVYVGDIVPVKQLPLEWKGLFPFIVEAKTGYKQHIPTINKQTIIHKWVNKLLDERTDEQNTPLLIVRFHYQSAIILMPFCLKSVPWSTAINIPIIGDGCVVFYVYNLNQLLHTNFSEFYAEIAN